MSELTPGAKIGGYEITGELGAGAMGVVYSAREEALGRTVAIKMLSRRMALDSKGLDRFMQEARASARLNHPNIVTIYALGEHQGSPFIVMEYVAGRELSRIIREDGPMPVRRALEITAQVASALAAAHGVGIVHRDIKPHNIMIDDAGRAKVMDFGIAKMHGEVAATLTEDGSVLGTPAYMSPEQCMGDKLDGRSDLYSLGVVLYQMLAGKLPYDGTTPGAVIQKILNEDPLPITDMRPELDSSVLAIIDRLLAKHVDDRYFQAEALEEALRGAMGMAAIPASTGSMSELPTQMITAARTAILQATRRIKPSVWRRATKRNRYLGAAVAFVFVAGLISMAWKGDPPEEENSAPIPEVSLSQTFRSSLPVIEWSRGPEEGARIADKTVTFEWKIQNAAPAEGFLVGLNDLNPKIRISETKMSFELIAAGPQIVKVVPLGERGVKGMPIVRTFIYEPAELPVATLPEIEIGPEFGSEGNEIETAAAPEIGPRDATRDLPKPSSPGQTRRQGVIKPREDSKVGSSIAEAIQLFSGTGGKVDEARARELIESASREGDAVAQMWRAWFMHWGRSGFTKSPARASDAALAAMGEITERVKLHDADAEFLLGAALDQGIGTKADPFAGKKWIAAAAEQGHSTAMNYLGWMNFEGRGGKQDLAEARRWFEKGAQAGDANAMHNLAWMYLQGRGVTRDGKIAFAWLSKAASMGSPRAMASLGYMYQEGNGTVRDDVKAVEWFERAARLGDSQALFVLATRYERGEGVIRDRGRAIELYRQAARAGYEPADQALERMGVRQI